MGWMDNMQEKLGVIDGWGKHGNIEVGSVVSMLSGLSF